MDGISFFGRQDNKPTMGRMSAIVLLLPSPIEAVWLKTSSNALPQGRVLQFSLSLSLSLFLLTFGNNLSFLSPFIPFLILNSTAFISIAVRFITPPSTTSNPRTARIPVSS